MAAAMAPTKKGPALKAFGSPFAAPQTLGLCAFSLQTLTVTLDRTLVQHRPPSMSPTHKGPGLKAFDSPHLPLADPLQPCNHWGPVLFLLPNPYPNPEGIHALLCHVGSQGQAGLLNFSLETWHAVVCPPQEHTLLANPFSRGEV